MNEQWSLDAIYKSYQDPLFMGDIKEFEATIIKGCELSDSLSHTNEEQDCLAILTFLEHQYLLELKLTHYTALRQSCDTSDSETVALMEKVNTIISKNSKTIAKFNHFIADISDLDTLVQNNNRLKEYEYLLKQTKEDGKYLLQEDVEEVIAKLTISGASAWEDMQSYLTSIVDIPFEGEELTLSAIRNKAYDADKNIRKKAYEAELRAYAKIDDAIAYSLNSIKAQVITVSELRGYTSPIDETLHQSHMKLETLDVMIHAIEEYLPIFQSYLKRKATMLGYTNGLPWYELFAPLGNDDHQYTLQEAKDYLLIHFRPFADDLADMIEEAFDQGWIDFYPRKGKVGGAFCENLPYIKQSRIMTNYGGSLGDIVTLAHELGHAYHGMMIQDHRILNTDYSMPVAETASTFNENIIMNAAIDQAESNVKIGLIETQLQDLTQIMCDIYSRYLFETEVFKRRKEGFLFAKDLNEIMLHAQRLAYGDALDPTYLHPYMWINKGHYYSADLSYYNFPYAFGGLLARGLVVKYQEMGDSFLDKYRSFLKATTISSVEDSVRVVDIDITDKAFWISCLETCCERVDEFLELTK